MNQLWMCAVLAIGSTLSGSAAADISPRALARAKRTPESRCASPLCQDVADDGEPATTAPPVSDEPPPFSLALGVGAAWIVTRVQRWQVETIHLPNPSSGDPSSGAGSDVAVVTGPPSDPGVDEDMTAAYPSFSLALDMQQPLVSLGSVDLRIAERFSIASAPSVPGEDLSTVVGFADILLGVHIDDFPVQAGIGPALGVATLREPYQSWGEALLVGVIGIVRVELPGMPGTLDAVVRGTRLLTSSPEAGSYRDAQIAYAFPL